MKRLLGVGGLNRFYERAILALGPAVTNKGFFFFILFYLFIYLFIFISVLRPSNIFEVISGAVSYPNHTVPGQAS